MGGGKLCLVGNHQGRITGWVWALVNAHDSWFHPVIEVFEHTTVVLGDTGFHAQSNNPPNLKVCQHGKWNDRMLIETVLLMLTMACHFKKVRH